ncbi:hypothetical protein HNR21_004082 [Actinomadura cellulosilytica]|uniref:Uncharacterized protein n=1 Tax=Thermomonospora cellulosilytica TaxID=1411118 RepID=A0A7W3N0D4_9ACTN|nr:hypothetical protein [Thermomonospora cellulosilytica]
MTAARTPLRRGRPAVRRRAPERLGRIPTSAAAARKADSDPPVTGTFLPPLPGFTVRPFLPSGRLMR